MSLGQGRADFGILIVFELSDSALVFSGLCWRLADGAKNCHNPGTGSVPGGVQ